MGDLMGDVKRAFATLSLVVGFLVAIAGPAHATGWVCANKATVQKVVDVTSQRTGEIVRYGAGAPMGAPWTPHGTDDALQRNHYYELRGVDVTVNFGGVLESLSSNAIVALACSGVAAGHPLNVPSLEMLRGSVDVHTTKSVPASVSTEEGLFAPVPGSAATAFRVQRVLANSKVTVYQELMWLGGYDNQPSGTTRTNTLTALKLNVTPYVGADPGTCRHVDSAVLTTTTSGGHGTAIYH